MAQPAAYAVVRVHDDKYRLDRVTPPGEGQVAVVERVSDRRGNALGWRLKPLTVMQGSRSRIWPTPAEAFASTRLFGTQEARDAVRRADAKAKAGGLAVSP
jgi:hypothetical protein